MRRFGDNQQNVVARQRSGLGRIGDHVVELAPTRTSTRSSWDREKTGIGRLGSVSSVIVNDARSRSICVPPQAQIARRTVPVVRSVVIATDLSAFANRAVAYGFAIAEPDAEVHIVHVTKGDVIDHGELSNQLSALAPPNTKQRVTPHVIHGDDAAETIAQCAARLGADVICIASHGRSASRARSSAPSPTAAARAPAARPRLRPG